MQDHNLRAKLSHRAARSAPQSSCRAECCRSFKRGRFGHAWEPLPPFMIGAACQEKLSFFPRACGTSFAGPARAAAEELRPVVTGAVIDVPLGAPAPVGRVQTRSWQPVLTLLAICRNTHSSRRAVTMQCCRVISHWPSVLSGGDRGAVSQACLPLGRLLMSLLFFFHLCCQIWYSSYSLLPQQISQGGIAKFLYFYCLLGHFVCCLNFYFFFPLNCKVLASSEFGNFELHKIQS